MKQLISTIHFQTFIPALEKRLEEPLPGDIARKPMSPSIRWPKGLAMPDRSKARPCGVLLMLYPHQGSVYTALMQRPEDGYHHSGQISLPGGRRENKDNSLIDTALREAEEEFGVPRQSVTVLGCLSEIYILASNSLVLPVVGCLAKRPQFTPDPNEVAQIIEVDVAHLFDPAIIKTHTITRYSSITIEAPYYHIYHEHILWGATSMMMAEFLAIAQDVLK